VPNDMISVEFSGLIATFSRALGQETGWRGILQPHLNTKFGVLVGSVFLYLLSRPKRHLAPVLPVTLDALGKAVARG